MSCIGRDHWDQISSVVVNVSYHPVIIYVLLDKRYNMHARLSSLISNPALWAGPTYDDTAGSSLVANTE